MYSEYAIMHVQHAIMHAKYAVMHAQLAIMHAQHAIMHAQLAIMHAQLVLHQHAVCHACTTCYLPCATCPTATCILSRQHDSTWTVMSSSATLLKLGPL